MSGVRWDIGDLLKWWHDPGVLLECQVETASSWGVANAGFLQTKQGNGPSSWDEGGEPGIFLSCGRILGVSSQVETIMSGNSLSGINGVKDHFRGQEESGISLEMPQSERVSSHVEG